MNKTEAVVICVTVVAGTTAAILGGLTEPLAILLGAAIGYGGGRTVSSIPPIKENG